MRLLPSSLEYLKRSSSSSATPSFPRVHRRERQRSSKVSTHSEGNPSRAPSFRLSSPDLNPPPHLHASAKMNKFLRFGTPLARRPSLELFAPFRIYPQI